MNTPLRIAFMGTPDFVVPTLQALIEGLHDVVCVYTQPPRQKGRHKKLEKTPIHLAAEKAKIAVRHPVNFKELDDIAEFQALQPDVAVVAAFGMLLPSDILETPRYGCINIHPSLLPRWRGPSPVQYAIWKGDHETGVSVMSLEKEMDTGPILVQKKTPMTKTTTFEKLNIDLWQEGTNLLTERLDDLAKTQTLKATVQNQDGVTYCKLLTKQDGHINWLQSAEEIDCQVRALNPWPGTWSVVNDKRLKILASSLSDKTTSETAGTILAGGHIACGGGSVLELQIIQPENKKPMAVKVALNGSHLVIGDVFS